MSATDTSEDQIGKSARHDHHDAHDEDPHQQLHLHGWIGHGKDDEGDERDTRNTVGLEPVRARTDGVACVVTRAVGNHARVSRVIFLDVEHDLHQIGADVGDLGEDSAGDSESRCAERFTNGESDETRSRVIARDEEQDEQHDHQLDADEKHADAHARL